MEFRYGNTDPERSRSQTKWCALFCKAIEHRPFRNLVIEIRPAEQADIPAMAVIRAQEWETEAYWVSRIGAYLCAEQSPQQAGRARSVFVTVDEPTVVGFVAGHQTRRFGCDGELQWINVARERRGQGIAAQLIVRMGEWVCLRRAGSHLRQCRAG